MIKMIAKITVFAGLTICFVSMTSLLHKLVNPESLGPNLAVCILTITYPLFIILILVLIETRLKQRLIEQNYIKA